ncbi:MAG: hypothetical protein J6C82_00820 [Clostridia bacterium]|nr:hypothetical protein [Clostridia bacterium]
MITCVDKRNEQRAEFDMVIEKNIDNLSSPALVEKALKLEKLLSKTK